MNAAPLRLHAPLCFLCARVLGRTWPRLDYSQVTMWWEGSLKTPMVDILVGGWFQVAHSELAVDMLWDRLWLECDEENRDMKEFYNYRVIVNFGGFPTIGLHPYRAVGLKE